MKSLYSTRGNNAHGTPRHESKPAENTMNLFLSTLACIMNDESYYSPSREPHDAENARLLSTLAHIMNDEGFSPNTLLPCHAQEANAGKKNQTHNTVLAADSLSPQSLIDWQPQNATPNHG